jgi:hypothetical protein
VYRVIRNRVAGDEAVKRRCSADIEFVDASEPPMLMRCPDRPSSQRGCEAAFAGTKAQELGIRPRQGAPSLCPIASIFIPVRDPRCRVPLRLGKARGALLNIRFEAVAEGDLREILQAADVRHFRLRGRLDLRRSEQQPDQNKCRHENTFDRRATFALYS